jgi:hypothetical protein
LPLKNGWWQKRFSETARLEASAKLARAQPYLNRLATNSFVGTNLFAGTADMGQFRLATLKYQAFGSDNGQNFAPEQVVPLPDNDPKPALIPKVADIFPSDVELDPDADGKPQPRDQRFAILGENLKQISLTEITPLVGQIKLTQRNLVNDAIFLTATITGKEPVIFNLPWVLTNTDGTTIAMSVNTPKITITVRKPLEKPASENTPVAVLKTTSIQAAAPGSPSQFSVEFAPKADEKQLNAALSIVTAEINKNKPVDKNTNNCLKPNKP